MNVLAVDLAAKLSAACWLDGDVIRDQWDSWLRPESAFVHSLIQPFEQWMAPEVCLIEDLPHRLPFSGTTKAVSRLQGRIYDRFEIFNHATKIIFVSPVTWRNHYPALRKRGSGPDAVVDVCADLGYTPPDLTERAKGNGGATRARKVATDYCAAWLIARWGQEMREFAGTYEVPGTSRYGQKQILKSKGA